MPAMPRAWEYPRGKHIAMQAAMWVILLATVGLAALVDYDLVKAMRVPLGEAITAGPFTYRLPADWKPTGRFGKGGRSVSEPSDRDGGRTLTVMTKHAPMMTPLEFLLRAHFISDVDLDIISQGGGRMDSTTIDGWPALQLSWTQQQQEGEQVAVSKTVMACAVLPSRQAIVERLDGPGPLQGADFEVVREVIASTTISGGPTPRVGGGEVDLPGGTTVNAPQDFLTLNEADPARTDRQILYAPDYGGWILVDLVPLVLPPDTAPTDIKTELMVRQVQLREFDWAEARIAEIAPRRWRISLPPRAQDFIVPRAYLLQGEGAQAGQGLLVVMHATQQGRGNLEARMEGAWQSIADSVKFAPPADVAGQLRLGDEFAAIVSRRPVPEIVGPAGQERWWGWTRNDNSIGWGRWANAANEPAGSRSLALENWDNTVTRVEEQWAVAGPLRATTRTHWTDLDEAGSSLVEFLLQMRELPPDAVQQQPPPEGGKKRAVMKIDLTAENVQGSSGVHPVPLGFVPSALLPEALGKLSDLLPRRADRPMILRTDRFPGEETAVTTGSLTLLVTQVGVAPAEASPDTAPAARCVTVQVNGSGQMSRWYFATDGTLERAEFADGVKMKPAEVQDLLMLKQDSRLSLPPQAGQSVR